MKINEIFYSIQGEGLWMGFPNIFIRFTGCNLRCSYCDTKYAYEEGKILDINEIIEIIKKYPCKFVCITGGEPLIQEDILSFIKNLQKRDYNIVLETNGSINIEKVIGLKGLLISLDIKCPSSNMHKKMIFKNISLLNQNDQIKFVIKNITDYEYAKDILNKYKTKANIFFQPVWGIDLKNFANWILKDGLNVKIGFQLHKYIWGNKREK